ncbi:MAG: carboxy-S-adenosyl-L-methionine synthase CmoA [Gammaproteobacteria bacterium]|nr:MAG: carboxy-S-adenosyl-L-methionine synthase CmoA [Gammaproteobacteria bacterium]
MSENSQDSIYKHPREAITGFVFDESVTRVFQDMISRSVPGYASILAMLPVLVRKYIQPDTRCYDLGCSLGAATLAMRHAINVRGVEIIAVDNAESMIAKCREYIHADKSKIPVQLQCADIKDVAIENASFVVMNFTLQFVAPTQRQALLTNICAGMKPGAAMILSEKIIDQNPQQQTWMTELHHEFKRANGYSELEISQKRTALENVLIPDTFELHEQRLRAAGFSQVMMWFRCFNFVSMLAVK